MTNQDPELSSIKEVNDLSEGDQKATKEHDDYKARFEKGQLAKDTALNRIFICVIWILFGAFIILFLIRLLHMVIPESCYWLTSNQLNDIERLVFSGSVGGFIGNYFRKQT